MEICGKKKRLKNIHVCSDIETSIAITFMEQIATKNDIQMWSLNSWHLLEQTTLNNLSKE